VTPRKFWKEQMDQILERSGTWGHCSARFHTFVAIVPLIWLGRELRVIAAWHCNFGKMP
jgi:hypothetical protein